MRTIKEYTVKDGENRITVPINHSLVGVWMTPEEIQVVVEIDTEDKEFTEIAVLVTNEGDEIKEEYTTNLVGCGWIQGRGKVVWEIL